MEDREFLFLCCAILGLCGLSMLHSRIERMELDLITGLREDVNWLKDNTVATTETRA
jgi:hypothetical protein